jgi:hypothetical protein
VEETVGRVTKERETMWGGTDKNREDEADGETEMEKGDKEGEIK